MVSRLWATVQRRCVLKCAVNHGSWTNNALTWNFVSNCKKSAKETHKMLKLVYADAAVTTKMVYKWFERLRNGCELVEDEERSGHPSTSKTQENVERVSKIIRSNRRLTIREISEDLNISYGSIQNILTTDLTWDEWVRNLFHVFWRGWTKATAFVNFIGVVRSCCFRFQLFIKYRGRWNLGLWLWSWDQGSEFLMEITQFSLCKRSTSIKIQHQGGGDCVFWPWWNCVSWVCTQEHYGELWIL